jgi:hypothetical protein
MKKEEFIEALLLFNQKVEKLESLSFIPKALEGTKASITWKELAAGYGKITTERIGPTPESIDAFVLTFRFFIQNNEICSLHNLSRLYDTLCTNMELRNNFEEARSTINKFLGSGPQLGINFLGENLTYRKIMDIIIYGDLSHANKEKKVQLQQWMNSPLCSLIENALVSALVIFYQYVNRIKRINAEVLKEVII